MSHDSRPINPLNWLLGAAALVVVIAGIRASQDLVVPMLIATFLAVICAPAMKWLQAKGVPVPLAILVVIGAVTLVVSFVIGVAGASITDFVRKAPDYQEHLNESKEAFLLWLTGKGVPIPEEWSDLFETRRVMAAITSILGSLGILFSNAFLVLLIVLFMLLEAAGLPRKLRAASNGEVQSSEQAEKIRDAILSYMVLKTATSLLTGILVATMLKAMGVDYALLWGLLAFFFNFIPNIGSIIAAVPAVILALVQNDLSNAVFVAIGYLVINVVIGNFLEPRIMGRGLGLSTLVVFISLVFWGWVLGPVGMLLSVPLTMLVKIVMENFEQTRWIAILLSSNPESRET